ncbi:hypothetical protein [Pseudonocardia kunmingensis]|uniref:Uncharacterized protein n=1 Tax=Pseudonocardia kunmingensis TaxID=630975 RepID=A0A543DI04_9PSEU|nr:hypothetical protein [Pseudonocardia kunmingensis]TQM08984.1 hypothetical protein FB558_4725 [Pseudonocardia kunmingensis]
MDEDMIRATASAAAGVIIRAIGTTAWDAMRDRWSRTLGQGLPDEEAVVADQLDESAEAMTSTDPAEREQRAAELEAEWRGTLRAQLRSDPDLVAAVRELVAADSPTARVGTGPLTQTANVRRGVSIQSGRDTTITSAR